MTREMDEALKAQFAEWLRGQLASKGMNFQTLASEVGVSPSNARNWTIGGNLPSWHNCRDLADALHLSTEEVRRRAGFVDPEAPAPAAGEEEIDEIVALARAGTDEDRAMLLRLARLQSGTPRRRRPTAER